MRISLEARPEPSRLMGWLSPLFAAAATLVLWLGVTLAGRGRWIVNLIG